MKKLLWHSNAGWTPTGYGQQTNLFTTLLADHYDVTVSAFYGLEGAPLQLNEKIRVLPGRGQTFGNELIRGHAQTAFGGLRDGLVLTLLDVWVLNPEIWKQMNVCSWVPIDHEPAPPQVSAFFRASGAIPIAMSRFGQKQLSEFDALYVPHGIDTEVFRPLDQLDARMALGFNPDEFMVGVVAANKGFRRKCLPEILEAFAHFHAKRPDSKLYLHTETSGIDQGVNVVNLINSLGIPENAVAVADQYRLQYNPASPEMMAALYSSFDVLLSPSRGEGFGIAPLEAQACGTPVIVSDFSAQPEVCGSGWLVDGKKEWTEQQAWQFLPSVQDIAQTLDRAYLLDEGGKRKFAEKARAHAMQYDARQILTEHFLPALDEVQARFDARKPVELQAA